MNLHIRFVAISLLYRWGNWNLKWVSKVIELVWCLSGYKYRSIWFPSSWNTCNFRKYLYFIKPCRHNSSISGSLSSLRYARFVHKAVFLCHKVILCLLHAQLWDLAATDKPRLFCRLTQVYSSVCLFSLLLPAGVRIRECPGPLCPLVWWPQCHFRILNRTCALTTQAQMPRAGSRRMLSSLHAVRPTA